MRGVCHTMARRLCHKLIVDSTPTFYALLATPFVPFDCRASVPSHPSVIGHFTRYLAPTNPHRPPLLTGSSGAAAGFSDFERRSRCVWLVKCVITSISPKIKQSTIIFLSKAPSCGTNSIGSFAHSRWVGYLFIIKFWFVNMVPSDPRLLIWFGWFVKWLMPSSPSHPSVISHFTR